MKSALCVGHSRRLGAVVAFSAEWSTPELVHRRGSGGQVHADALAHPHVGFAEGSPDGDHVRCQGSGPGEVNRLPGECGPQRRQRDGQTVVDGNIALPGEQVGQLHRWAADDVTKRSRNGE